MFSKYELATKETLLKKIAELESESLTFQSAIISVLDLIANSSGVSGLHQSGDIAQWDELLEGGNFEDWLIDFSKAAQLKGK